MIVKKIISVSIILALSVARTWSVQEYHPSVAEDSLKILFQALSVNEQEERDEQIEPEVINKNIIRILSRTLRHEQSFDYDFDSLPLLGKITASDNLLSIYTWNYPLSPVDHKYYCFLQYRGNDNDSISVFFLDHSDTKNDNPEQKEFYADNWYGALYYQVHPVRYFDKTFYTVLGFDFDNVYTNIKILDVIHFINGTPVLGSPVFQFRDKIQHRVIFKYSSRAVMFMRYIPERDMIVYDHLSPSAPGFEGRYRYYGPDFSYDGFRFKNGKWIHIPDIEWK